MAVNLDEGLIVPVIFNADQKDLGQIAREGRDLAEKARAGRLQLDEINDGTFTITNLGTTGIDLFTPIINPPQVAILGVVLSSSGMRWRFAPRSISHWYSITGPWTASQPPISCRN